MTHQLEVRLQRLQAELDPTKPGRANGADCTDFALDALDARRPDLAIKLLQPIAERGCQDAVIWQCLGLAFRDTQQMDKAVHALSRAHELSPTDPRIAMAVAQARFERGDPAAQLFERAAKLAPGHLGLLLNQAMALAAEGEVDKADTMLSGLLGRAPEWIEGHEALSLLRWMRGRAERFRDSLDRAIARHPANVGLRLSLYRILMQTDHAGDARIVLDAAGPLRDPALDASRACWEAEHGDSGVAMTLFNRLPGAVAKQVAITHVRLLLKAGHTGQAETRALAALDGGRNMAMWPYLSTIWRLTGNRRAAWLDGEPPYIENVNLGLSVNDLATLGEIVRGLHTANASFPAQSVRGGTQTDQPLFHRPEPELTHLRQYLIEAFRTFVDRLPPRQAGHPLLESARNDLRFQGSWSVRREGGGFHVTHTHPHGWISAVFYIDRPSTEDMGRAPAGWLELGTPPPELGLNLPAYATVEPVPGRLVIFPSTMWHRTLPFASGERLTIACDLQPPAY